MKISFFTIFFTLLLSSKLVAGLDFIENQGQWEDEVFFASMRGAMHVGIAADGLLFIQNNEREHHLAVHHHGDDFVSPETYAYKLQFIGCNPVLPKAKEWDSTYYNFFIGEDESAWRSRVPAASKVLLSNLYDGIDLLVYSVNNRLKYDFIVHPGADPQQIAWEYLEGIAALNEEGDLELDLPLGMVRENAPFAYQLDGEKLKEVYCKYDVDGKIYRFQIEDYNENQKLVLDPEVIWSTYTADYGAFLASHSSDQGTFTIVRENSYGVFWDLGLYIGPEDNPSQFVWCFEQLNSSGSDFEWVTFVGGDGPGGYCYSLNQSADGSFYAYGFYYPESFPITFNGQSFSDNYYCLINLSSDGASLISSTYFVEGMPEPKRSLHYTSNEASPERDWGAGLHPIDNNLILIYSTDEAAENLPNTQSFGTLNELHTVVVCFSSNLEEILWCKEIGALGEGCEVHQMHSFLTSTGRLFIGGRTSCELPVIGTDAYDASFSGSSDGFFMELEPSTGDILYSSYVGEGMADELNLFSEDNEGHLWLAGRSESHDGSNLDFELGNGEMFLFRLNEGLSATTWQGRIGQIEADVNDLSIRGHRINSLNFDACGRLVASTQYAQRFNADEPLNVLGFPLLNNTNTVGAHYFFSLDLQENELLWGDYYGGGSSHNNRGFRFHGNDQMHFGTCVEHLLFGDQAFIQATPGAFSADFEEYLTTNLTLFDFNTGQSGFVQAAPEYSISNASCEETMVSFSGSEGLMNYWNISNGDSLQSTTSSVNYSFELPGVYEVAYTVEDSSSCNVRSTAVFSVEIPELSSGLSFSWNQSEVFDPCLFPQTVTLEFTGSGADELSWSFPNGTELENEALVTYEIMSPGAYIFALEATDLACDSVASDAITLNFYQGLDYEVNYSIHQGELCEASEVFFEVNGSGIDNYQWFYDGVLLEENTELIMPLPVGQQVITLELQNEPCAQNLTTELLIDIPPVLEDHSLFIPNVFTPNGEGKNERFQIAETDVQALMMDFHLEVMNRWGQVCYSSSDPYFKWDGSDQNTGESLIEGTYFYTLRYQLNCAKEHVERTGKVMILR